ARALEKITSAMERPGVRATVTREPSNIKEPSTAERKAQSAQVPLSYPKAAELPFDHSPILAPPPSTIHHPPSTIPPSPSSTFLLHGVTGSGKTEIYLQAIAHTLHRGKGAIVLVPEISITPQTVERFKARFSSGPRQTLVAVLHSHLSAGERHDEWHKIRQGRARIVIGARSAIFAPVDPLGLIIVDEEHE